MQGKIKVYAGGGRSGKSTFLYNEIIDKAWENPDKNYYLIVPEQATSILERKFIALMKERHNAAGFFNISIVGFNRLAHLIFEEVGFEEKIPLEEYGKSMLIRASLGKLKDQLKVYKGSIDKRGFIDNLKSAISEFLLFDIRPEDLKKASESLDDSTVLKDKLHDITAVYEEFLQSQNKSHYSVPEERLSIFSKILEGDSLIDRKNLIRDAEFYFDCFTGFTAVQINVLKAIKKWAAGMVFAITIDSEILESKREVKEYELYYESYDMYIKLIENLGEAEIKSFKSNEPDNELKAIADNLFRFPVKTYQKENSGAVEISKSSTALEEIKCVAERIRREVRDNNKRYRDFALITGALQEISPIAEEVFRDYDIPFFSDYKRMFSSNPYTESIRELLLIIDRDFSYDNVFSFFKTGVMDSYFEKRDISIDDHERYENFCIAHGIRGKRLFKKPVTDIIKKKNVPKDLLSSYEKMDKVREAFFEVISPVLDTVGKGKKVNVRKFTEAIRRMIGPTVLDFEGSIEEAGKVLESLERPAEEMAYHAISAKLDEILLKMEDILGDEELTVHEYMEVLSTGIDNLAIGVIPPVQDAVLIGDPERTRLIDIDTVFFINMNDGIVPSKAAAEGIITERDREKIDEALDKAALKKRLAPGATLKSYIEFFTLYLIFEKAVKHLYLSYSESAMDGRELERSFIIGRVEKLLPNIKEEKRERKEFAGTCKSDIFDYTTAIRQLVETMSREYNKDIANELVEHQKKKDEDAYLNAVLKLGLYKEAMEGMCLKCNLDSAAFFLNKAKDLPLDLMKDLDIKISVSKLERYALCPYLYYLTYILKLKERREHKTDDLDLGLIVHSALEKAFKSVRAEYDGDFNAVTDEELYKITEDSCLEAISEEKEELLDEEERRGKDTFILNNIKKMAHDTMEALAFQMRAGKMRPEFIETAFKAEFEAKRPDGTLIPIQINGKIDRGDIFAGDDNIYVRIIDYKTGNKKLEMKKILSGENIQLSLYLGIILKIIREKYKDTGVNVIPSGFYYYHVSGYEAVEKEMKEEYEIDSDEEILAARESALKNQRLRGLPNIGEDLEDKDKAYYSLKIQEEQMINPEGGFRSGLVLPINAGKKGEINASSKYATAEEIDAITAYSFGKMEETTKKLLSGNIDKSPLCDISNKQGDSCNFCPYLEVCRFMKGSGNKRYRVNDKKAFEKIIGEGRELKVNIKNARFMDKEEESRFIDDIEYDLDDLDVDERE